MPSPLYPNFNRRQSAALRHFRQTSFSKAVRATRRRYAGGQIPPSEMQRIASRFAEKLGDDVMRYGADAFWKGLTSRMGLFGQVIESLLRPNGRRTAQSVHDELDAAQHLLESFGYTVKSPERIELTPRDEVRVRVGPKLDRDDDQAAQQPQTGPEVIGMIPVTSSNVHSIGYEWPTADRTNPGNLLVRFLGGEGKSRAGEGSLYRYHHVPFGVFEAFERASSKGKFVWDELRVRGTVSGHQYAYDLAGTDIAGYIPRQAGLKRGMQDEWHLKRSFQGRQSQKPERAVRRSTGALRGFEEGVKNLRFRAGRRS